MVDKKEKNRRHFLKQGLIVVSGLTFGYSLIPKVWAKEAVMRKTLKPRLNADATKLRSPGRLTLSSAKRSRAARSIVPTLKELLNNAGLKIKPGEMNALQKAFERRGTILIPGGDPGVASTLTLGGTVTWE